jgi:hypothetical protein
MRSRFFSASSYDDEEEEYDEQMDLSGFVTSAPPAPPVIERKRSPKPAASSMGNAGPKMHAPTENIGYVSPVADRVSKKLSAGNPWNPLYAHDDTLLPKTTVAVKTTGLLLGMAGGGLSVFKSPRKFTVPVAIVGLGAYTHTALGFNKGALDNMLANQEWYKAYPIKLAAQGVGLVAFTAAYKYSRGKRGQELLPLR